MSISPIMITPNADTLYPQLVEQYAESYQTLSGFLGPIILAIIIMFMFLYSFEQENTGLAVITIFSLVVMGFAGTAINRTNIEHEETHYREDMRNYRIAIWENDNVATAVNEIITHTGETVEDVCQKPRNEDSVLCGGLGEISTISWDSQDHNEHKIRPHYDYEDNTNEMVLNLYYYSPGASLPGDLTNKFEIR